ncbi:hypothetical protein FRB99_002817, partial [Tulasnella sp. 403]
ASSPRRTRPAVKRSASESQPIYTRRTSTARPHSRSANHSRNNAKIISPRRRIASSSRAAPHTRSSRPAPRPSSIIEGSESGEEEDADEDAKSVEEMVEPKKEPTPTPVTSSRIRKAKETQRRLGVGRPVAAGGTGARRSTAKGKAAPRPSHIVEVVVPTLDSLLEERREREPTEDGDDDQIPTSTRHQPPSNSSSKSIASATRAYAEFVTKVDGLENRIDRTESALADERHKVSVLEDQVEGLLARLERLEGELISSQAELAVFREMKRSMAEEVPEGANASTEQNGPESGGELPQDQTLPAKTNGLSSQTAQREPPSRAGLSPAPPTQPNLLVPSSAPTSGSSAPSPANLLGNSASTTHPAPVSQTRALSNQPPEMPTSLGTFHRPGKRARDSPAETPSGTNTPLTSPRKRMRVDQSDDDGMNGMSEETGNAVAASQPPVLPNTLTLPAGISTQSLLRSSANQAENAPGPSTNGRRASARASSQPPRRTGLRNIGVDEPTLGRSVRGSSVGANGQAPVRQWHLGRFGAGGTTLNNTSTQALRTETIAEQPAEENEVASAAVAPQEPAPQAGTSQPFVTYPLPDEPVKELKPLTHFDSGSEFFGTISKQQYRTDWHEGTVFDDPWDADTVRRTRSLAGEEPVGGEPEGHLHPQMSEDDNLAIGLEMIVPGRDVLGGPGFGDIVD